jgi:hypothetical protein
MLERFINRASLAINLLDVLDIPSVPAVPPIFKSTGIMPTGLSVARGHCASVSDGPGRLVVTRCGNVTLSSKWYIFYLPQLLKLFIKSNKRGLYRQEFFVFFPMVCRSLSLDKQFTTKNIRQK